MSARSRLHGDVTSEALKSLPNPAHTRVVATIEIPECTFLGGKRKPDFAHITLTYVANARIIELKSLKEYMWEWRDTLVSYERLADTMWSHLVQVYAPHSLILTLTTTPRGGISSTLVIDSEDQRPV